MKFHSVKYAVNWDFQPFSTRKCKICYFSCFPKAWPQHFRSSPFSLSWHTAERKDRLLRSIPCQYMPMHPFIQISVLEKCKEMQSDKRAHTAPCSTLWVSDAALCLKDPIVHVFWTLHTLLVIDVNNINCIPQLSKLKWQINAFICNTFWLIS